MRSRHVPLQEEKSDTIKQEFNEFFSEMRAAGEILYHLREEKGWSEWALGAKVDLSEEQIILMEDGEQPIPLEVAKKLGVLFDKDYHLFL